jgi:TolB-like protein/Flp pilus assembly protein TadD
METEKPIKIRLAGGLRVLVEGKPAALPQSRKTRALLTFLALENRPVERAELCELLWENTDDPRAALRWSLSRLRAITGGSEKPWLKAGTDSIGIDSRLVDVDIHGVSGLLDTGIAHLDRDELLLLEKSFAPAGLGKLVDVGGVSFNLWLETARTTIAQLHLRLIRQLLLRTDLESEQRLYLGSRCVGQNPLNDAANLVYLQELSAQQGTGNARKVFQRVLHTYRQNGQSESALVAGWQGLAGKSRAVSASEREACLFGEGGYWPALPEKPSVAVLDFTCFGNHEGGDVLARGLTTDLNSRLARLPYFFVISRASSTRFSADSCSPQEIGRRLGVRYLLSGSTQRGDRRVRVTVNLLDASNGKEVWSEHYDRELDDLFSVQDEITGAVIAAMESAIELEEARRSLMKQPENLNAWEYFHRGLWHSLHFQPAENETANHLFSRAIELDPYFSRAHAGLSFTHFSRAFLNSADNVNDEIARAAVAGQASVDLDPRDSMGHWSVGRALFLSRQHDQALASIDQSLSINPNYAQGHYARGFIGIHAGQDEVALPFLDSAQRLSPFDPLLFAMKSSRGISLAHQGRFEEAAAWALRATHEPNAHFHTYAVAAGCLELAGRRDEAREKAGWVMSRRPDFSLDVFRRSFPHKDESRRRHFINALSRAGIPGIV